MRSWQEEPPVKWQYLSQIAEPVTILGAFIYVYNGVLIVFYKLQKCLGSRHHLPV